MLFLCRNQLIQPGMSVKLGAVLVRGHIALGQESAVECAGIAVAAQVGDLGNGIGGIPQEGAGAVDAQGVDVLAEIDVQLLGEDVAQVDAADAKGMGGAFQGERFGKMLGDIVQHLVAQAGMHVLFNGLQVQAVEQVGQEQVQVAQLQCGGLQGGELDQVADDHVHFRRLIFFGQQGIDRHHGAEGAAELGDRIGGEDQRQALHALGHHIIAVRDGRENHGNIAGQQATLFACNGHFQKAGGEADDLCRVVYVGGERMVADDADELIFGTLLVKHGGQGHAPPFKKLVTFAENDANRLLHH